MRTLTLFAALIAVLFASCASDTKSPEEGTTTEAAAAPAAEKPAIANTKDPVCGMPITAADATAYAEHDGKKLGFCSEECAAEFKKDPAQYASKLN